MTRILDLRRALLALPVLVALLAGAYFLLLQDEGEDEVPSARILAGERGTGLDAGDLAPDFEISTTDGERIRLSDLRGRAVLVNFWATWCGSCLAEMPDIKALQEQRGVDKLTVLAVNSGETPAAAQKFIDFLQAPFVYVLDSRLVVTDAYGVYGLPLSVFIDAQGVIRATYNGHANRQRLDAFAAAAIDAAPAAAFPDTIRPISTIPRERILYVTRQDRGRIEFASRSLRCDLAYCAEAAFVSVKTTAGVQSLRIDASKPTPTLELRYDTSRASEPDLVNAVAKALESHADPLYNTPLEVRYGKP